MDKPVKQILDKRRVGGVTIYGAIGLCLQKPVFELGLSTNIAEFKSFLQKLQQSVKPGVEKPYLLLDNHSAHRSREQEPFLSENFTVLFIPPYSCQFNSIEWVWGRLKSIFRRRFAQAVGNINTDEQFRNYVR